MCHSPSLHWTKPADQYLQFKIEKEMKRVFLVLFVCLSCVLSDCLADNPTPAQLKFRSSLMTFLKEEGFAPYIDKDDNSITFKKEGKFYWITIEDESPFFVTFYRGGFSFEGEDGINKVYSILAANDVNRDKKAVKLYCNDKNLKICVESFTRSIEDFKYVFYGSLRSIDGAVDEFIEKYKGYDEKSSPLIISSVMIANSDKDNNLLTQYGSSIYSYSTQYIKPRLSIKAKTAGEYPIYVKFYTADAVLSTGTDSPSGYSYCNTVTLTEGSNLIALNGWGSSQSGKWKAGNYRMEFYYKDKLIYTKYYTIN